MLLFIVIAIMPFAVESAEPSSTYSLKADFRLSENNVVNITRDYIFSPALNGTFNITVQGNITGLEARSSIENFSYSVISDDAQSVIMVTPVGSMPDISLDFALRNEIYAKEDELLFIRTFQIERPIPKVEVSFRMPMGYKIFANEYQPADGEISSDGEMIFLTWRKNNVQGEASYSVTFVKDNVLAGSQEGSALISPWIGYILIGLLILTLVAVLIFGGSAYYRSRKSVDQLLVGFREDERKVILYLKERKKAWQNTIRHAFNFERVKVTRIVKKLEKEGLVEKKNYGKTNMIFWKK
jgi:uncharacterized membrane protein